MAAKKKQTHADFVQAMYEAEYKPLGIAPAHVKQLKAVMLKASKKTKQNKASVKKAAQAFFKEKRIGAKAESKKTTTKKEETKKGAAVRAPKLKEDKERKISLDVRTLDRRSLVGMAKDLGVSVSKSATDDELRAQVARGMVGMARDAHKLLASIDDTKMKDCVGLFIDLTNVTCITCDLQKGCRTAFTKHQEGGFAAFNKMRTVAKTKATADEVEAEDVPPATRKKTKKKAKKAKKLDLKQGIDVFGIDVDDDDDSKDFLQQVMDDVPQNVGELKKVITDHYEVETDQETQDIIDQLVELSMIELS